MLNDFDSLFFTHPEWIKLAFWAPICVTLFGGITLLLIKHKSRDKKNLAYLLFAVCFMSVVYLITHYFLSSPPYEIVRFLDAIPAFYIGPLIINYFTSLVQPLRSHRKEIFYWILSGGFITVLYGLVWIFGMTYPENIYTLREFFGNLHHPEVLIRFSCVWIVAGHITICTVRVSKLRKEYIIDLKNTQSSMIEIDLKWVDYILYVLALFGTFGIIAAMSSGLFWGVVFLLYTALSMFLIFIFGFLQKDISPAVLLIQKEKIESQDDNTISPDKNAELMDKLDALMLEKKLYLNKDLIVQDLADALYTNRSYISKAINSQNQTFYDYVNDFRIKNAIEMLENYDGRIKMVHIAEDCGFKSYHVFCRLFKEATGCLPKEFVRRRGR